MIDKHKLSRSWWVVPVAAGKVIGTGGQCGMRGGMTCAAVKMLRYVECFNKEAELRAGC